ncbi:MAG: heat-inducible transcriptional repressor HrcA [bacterium]
MTRRELTDRECRILALTVQAYIEDAAPVGSRTLVRRFALDLSPATVRNVMNDLEAKGMLEQPHTSAGRVPTDIGYRVYVDEIMRPVELSRAERAALREALTPEAGSGKDAAAILDQTVRVMGDLTHLLAVSMEPKLQEGTFEKIELVRLGDRKVLAVLTISRGFLRTVVLELDAAVDRESLEATGRLLNERLSGLPMQAIRDSAQERVRDADAGDPRILKLILNNSDEIFAPRVSDEGIHYWGTPNILSLPEFADRERMLSLMEALEEKDIFVRILGQHVGDEGLTITIGEENLEGEVRFCSIVTSPYRVGEVSGSVAVVGPTRMEYSRLVSVVDYAARIVSEVLGEEEDRSGTGGEEQPGEREEKVS